MRRYKITALVLAVLLLAGCLSGCNKDEKAPAAPGEAPKEEVSQSGSGNQATALASKYAYAAEYIDIPVETNYIGNSCICSTALYFVAQVPVGEEQYTDPVTGESYSYESYEDRLYRMDLETKECKEVSALPEVKLEEGWKGDSYIQSMTPGNDGTVLVLQQTYTYRFNLPEGVEETSPEAYDYYESGENQASLYEIDATGAVVKEWPLAEAREAINNSGLNTLYLDEGGYLYASTWEEVFVWDKDGSFVTQLELEDGELRQYSADKVGRMVWGEEMTFQVLDPVKKAWGEELPLPENAWNFFPGTGDYDLYYDNNGKIFGYIAGTDTSEKVLDWLECDIDSNNLSNDSYQFLPDGRVVVILQDYRGMEASAKPQVAILTPVEANALPEKTVLTLACMYVDYELRSQIVNFNRTSQTYRIVVKDYSEYNTEDDYSAGLTKLNTEILSGQVPDLLATSSIPVSKYAAQGLLTDLWQFIDADENIKREDLMTQVLDAISIDGKLYQMPTTFYLNTVAGLDKVVGDYRDNWDLTSLMQAMESLRPEATIFSETTTKEEMLLMTVARGIDQFIDWNTGECSFDSPEFLELLNFVNQFAADFDYENYDWDTDYESDFVRIKDGRQLLTQISLSDFGDLSVYFAALDNQPCFVGFPVGAPHTLDVSSPVAISAASQHKDAAWAFVRSLVQEDYQKNTWGFPINRKVFDQKAEEAMTPVYQLDANGQPLLDEEGNKIEQSQGGMGWGNDEMYEIYAVTQEQYDTLMELLANCSGGYSYDEEISEILSEATAPFFAGEKSAEDTAREIQSRVKLYVAEQL